MFRSEKVSDLRLETHTLHRYKNDVSMAINQAQLIDLLTEYRRENWRGIQTPEWQRKIVQSIAEYQEPAVLKRIAPFWTLPPDPVILDLGSGVGNFVVACRNRGLRAFGVEPD